MKKYLVLLTFLLLGAFICTACGHSKQEDLESKGELASEAESSTEALDAVTLENATDAVIQKMTLEEKIGQLFIVCTDSLDADAQTKISENMKKQIAKYNPGGIVFFSYNMKSRQQMVDYISNLQNATKIPLFIAVDEEGGNVQRLSKVKGMGVEALPSMYEIGKTGDETKATEIGEKISNSMKPIGFNLNFAPVADVCSIEDNTEIGSRSFGKDASVVSKMVAAEVKALQINGVSATLKHFPGQGNVQADTHKGYANLETTIETLRKKEFLPFEAGMNAGADFVMMSHISVECITQTETPSSLSHLMVSDILRNELAFRGVIITDAMNMKVITKFYSPGQAAVQAIEAGVDMVLMPEDLDEAYHAILEAVKNGDITEKEINARVKRIIATKLKREIIPVDSALFAKER